jgi:serine/threonine-protein kinase
VADTELIPGTVEEVVDRDMHRRMVAFTPFVIAIIGIVGLSSFLLGGDPLARNVMLGTMAVCFSIALWMLSRLRARVWVSTFDLAVFGTACAVTLTTAFYYFGVLSAALVLMPVGAFVFPVVSSRRGMLAAFGFMMMHFILAALTISGVLADRGLIRPLGLSPAGQYLSLFITDLVAVAAYFIGRQTQFSAQRALFDLERATREAAQRGDLLAEARADLAQALRVGRAGRFTGQSVSGMRLGTVLGRGAMGEVYEATREDGVSCAVKLLHPQLAVDRSYYARFVREARIAASLTVPNVVKVLDASEEDAVLPYLVMERLYGKDLALHLQDVTRLRVAEVLDMVEQVGLGLDAAHAAGIVHRDLKPQNVFRAESEQRVVWKVLDFGVSKLLEQSSTMSAGVVVGTPQYMAPEQARGEPVDARADLYSLALIAYRALTGRPPFVVNDVRALLAVGAVRMPPRPSAIAPIPKELDDVLAVGMSKDPADRFRTARALFEALRVAARGDVDKDVRTRAQSVLRRWPWDDLTRGENRERELKPLSE